MKKLSTTGDIARKLQVSVKDVDYVIHSRGIKESDRIGIFRLYNESAARRIINEIRHIHSKRGRPKRRTENSN